MTSALYLSQILGKSIIDSGGTNLGTVSDLAISTAEVFPRVVAVSFKAADKTPRMLSWQSNVAKVGNEGVRLSKPAIDLEYDYLQEDELLLARDLLHKQIVDVQGKKVVRVSDLKLSSAGDKASLRLLGAECGLLGRLQYMPSFWASLTGGFMSLFGRTPQEQLIAWNYIDLPGRDMSALELSVSHKRLHKLHPADVADIIEQLDPAARAAVFAHLDKDHAAETISEMEDEYQADVIEDLSEDHASDLLAKMDPDDAADVIADLDYDKAERLLRLMGFEDAQVIRRLLGYPKDTAGGIMTPEVAVATAEMTVAETIEYLRRFAQDADDLHYVYLVAEADKADRPVVDSKLVGVVTLYELLIQDDDVALGKFAHRDVMSVPADADQEDVAEMIAKYNLLALPVVDEDGCLLGTVTVDDVLDVLEEEAEEDLARATGRSEAGAAAAATDAAGAGDGSGFMLIMRRVGRALRWCLPQSISWMGVWLGFVVVAFLAGAWVQGLVYSPNLGEGAIDLVVSLGLAVQIIQVLLVTLPLILATIRYAVLRAIERLTDMNTLERPAGGLLYLMGAGIGLAHALLVYAVTLLIFVLNPLNTGGMVIPFEDLFSTYFQFCGELLLPLLLPLVVALLLTAVFAVWRVMATVAADDADADIKPARVAAAVMLVFVLVLSALSVPGAYLYYVSNSAEAGEDYAGDDFDYMGEEDYGDYVLDEGDLEDLDFGEDEGEDFEYEDTGEQELMLNENGELIEVTPGQ